MDLSIRNETFAADDQSWLGSEHGTNMCRPVTLDVSTFTAGTHYPQGFLKSGLPLGKITATGKYGLYSNAASDGRETLVGFLFTPIKAPAVNTTPVFGALYEHGRVVEAKLPVTVDSAGKADLAKQVIFA